MTYQKNTEIYDTYSKNKRQLSFGKTINQKCVYLQDKT